MGRARFSRAPKTFRTHKATVSSSTTKNGEACTPETPFMEGPLFILRDFAVALKRFDTFEEQFLIPVFRSSFSFPKMATRVLRTHASVFYNKANSNSWGLCISVCFVWDLQLRFVYHGLCIV